jgi:hypothetical protein
MKLTQKSLAQAAATQSIEQTDIHATADGFTVTARLRRQKPGKLYTDRGEIRAFKSWNTCMRYLRSIGITCVTVDMTDWEPEMPSVKKHEE